MKTRNLQKWEKFESELCKFLGMDHIGGSGKSDCKNPTDPTEIAEAKSYSRNFNADDLKREVKNAKTHGGKKIKIMEKHECTENTKKLAEQLPEVILTCNCSALFTNKKTNTA